MSTAAPFARMNGIGNEILVVDMRGRADRVTPQAALALAERDETRFDQIMAVHDPVADGEDALVRILNTDGSAAGACGNGMRCVTAYLNDESGRSDFALRTSAGLLNAHHGNRDTIRVDMGMPRFAWDQIPLSEEFADTSGIELEVGPRGAPILHTPSVVNMGNPHCVFFCEDDPDGYALDRFGPMIENHMLFPDRANVSIARLVGTDHLTMRTWERGVGLTRACGSAACAVAVSAARRGMTGRSVTIDLPGGRLGIDWQDNGNVVMTGAAEHEWSGTVDPASGAWERVS